MVICLQEIRLQGIAGSYYQSYMHFQDTYLPSVRTISKSKSSNHTLTATNEISRRVSNQKTVATQYYETNPRLMPRYVKNDGKILNGINELKITNINRYARNYCSELYKRIVNKIDRKQSIEVII